MGGVFQCTNEHGQTTSCSNGGKSVHGRGNSGGSEFESICLHCFSCDKNLLFLAVTSSGDNRTVANESHLFTDFLCKCHKTTTSVSYSLHARNDRKHFSPLWRPCEARASLSLCGKDLIKPFSPPMWCCAFESCLRAMKMVELV